MSRACVPWGRAYMTMMCHSLCCVVSASVCCCVCVMCSVVNCNHLNMRDEVSLTGLATQRVYDLLVRTRGFGSPRHMIDSGD